MIQASILHRRRGFTLDVNFESAGPVLGVFGRSGSGKTTLLNALAGLTRPQEIEISVQGEVLARRPGGVWLAPDKRGLALVPQDPLLFPHLSTKRNLTYARGARERLSAEAGRQVLDVLRLRPLLSRRTETLSGGERQRVALGRAWMAQPRMLLLDEPASSLDAELGREVLALLLEAKRTLEVPMVFVTHRASELLALADDCIVLEEGRVVAQGPPIEVLAKPRASGVAKLVGVDNLLRLKVLRHDEPGGVTLLDLGEGSALAAPLCAKESGESVDVGIYAEDVILCREGPGATSARNVLAGTLTALDPIGHEVLVTLLVGAQSLRVRITPGAARELGFEVGERVFGMVKTTACHLLS